MKRLLAIALLAAGATSLSAQHFTPGPESAIWIEGTAATRSFLCRGEAVDGNIAWRAGAPEGQVGMPVQALECENRRMTADMHVALKATEHTHIRFVLSAARRAGAESIRVTGRLTLSGVTRTVEFGARLTGRNGAFRISGTHPVKLSDYGIPAPTKLLGLIRVRDEVHVSFDLEAVPADSSAGALTQTFPPIGK